MNLESYEIDHLLYLVETFGCKSEHMGMPHRSECERLHDTLTAMKKANEAYWKEMESQRDKRADKAANAMERS